MTRFDRVTERFRQPGARMSLRERLYWCRRRRYVLGLSEHTIGRYWSGRTACRVMRMADRRAWRNAKPWVFDLATGTRISQGVGDGELAAPAGWPAARNRQA